MKKNVIYIPFSQKLYNNIIRFSDGKFNPTDYVEDLVRNYIEKDLESGPSEYWNEEQLEEIAEEFAPHVLERWKQEDKVSLDKRREENKPLVWKEITVSSGSEVRMAYGGKHYYAKVKGGSIIDDEEFYSPSEWATKVANNTSRNAWRDLWFKEPLSSTWIPAQFIRDQAIAARSQKVISDVDWTEFDQALGIDKEGKNDKK